MNEWQARAESRDKLTSCFFVVWLLRFWRPWDIQRCKLAGSIHHRQPHSRRRCTAGPSVLTLFLSLLATLPCSRKQSSYNSLTRFEAIVIFMALKDEGMVEALIDAFIHSPILFSRNTLLYSGLISLSIRYAVASSIATSSSIKRLSPSQLPRS